MDERTRFPSFHLLRALPSAGPIVCAVFVVQAVAAGLTGPLSALASGTLIGGLTSGAYDRAIEAAVLLGILFAVGPLLGSVQGVLGTRLGLRLSQRLRDRIMAAALALDLPTLEDSSTADRLASAMRLEQEGMSMREVVIRFGATISQRVRVVAMAAVLSSYLIWAGPLLLATAMLARWLARGEEYPEAERNPEARFLNHRGDYYESLTIDPPAAKEIRIFGLGEFLANRLARLREQFYDHVRAARRAALRRQLGGVLVGVLPATAVLVALAVGVASGQLGAAALAVQLQAIFGVLDLSGDDSWMQRGGAAASRVNALETMVRPRPTPTAADFSLSQPPDIHLDAVTFAYPTSDRPVLHNLNLRIPAGTSIALVGLNGAGKTTLIKLLAGLYRPESGRVLVNGRDLSSLPLEDWWQTLAVVFQDYVRFELTARENVGFDRDGDEALQRAAQAAALESVISKLPAGWDTTLSRAYTNGSDLSGGEWQRVALARTLYAVDRGAKIVVLDEPTAHLDVRAEAETFERVLELTKGLTVVLVSHRYSTVRRADLIALLDGGQIVEIGSPSELLARPSRYAAMFRSHRRLAESDE